MKHQCKHQGFSIISTLFIMIVLSTLASYMISINSAMHISSLMSIRGERAYFAAVSGLEWASIYVHGNVCNTQDPNNPEITQFTQDGHNYRIECTSETWQEDASPFQLFNIKVITSQGVFGTEDYISYTLQASLSGKP